MTKSEWIDIIGIVVNTGLAIWIVCILQKRENNRRILKDHFICEVKELRLEYRIFLDNLFTGRSETNTILPWFKLMNIKISHLMELLNRKYKIEKEFLQPYQHDLRDMVTELEEFENNFKDKGIIVLGSASKNAIIKFQTDHSKLFNLLIVKINS